jgi:hypothetical protein
MNAVGMRRSKATYDPELYMHHATKAYRGRRGKLPRFVNFESRWRWVVISMFRPLYLRGREHWIGGRVGSVGLNAVTKDFLLTHRTSVVQCTD